LFLLEQLPGPGGIHACITQSQICISGNPVPPQNKITAAAFVILPPLPLPPPRFLLLLLLCPLPSPPPPPPPLRPPATNGTSGGGGESEGAPTSNGISWGIGGERRKQRWKEGYLGCAHPVKWLIKAVDLKLFFLEHMQ
jgi:hypothetical protein